jgi:hypothetical protein
MNAQLGVKGIANIGERPLGGGLGGAAKGVGVRSGIGRGNGTVVGRFDEQHRRQFEQ